MWAALLTSAASALGAVHAAERQPVAPAAGGGQFDCLIEPYRTITVRSPVIGVIDKLYVARGSAVRQGEPLVRLDSTVESAAADLALFKSHMNGELEAAESRLLHAQSKARRKSDMAASDFVSEQDREDAEAELAVASADVLAAREARQLASLEHAYAVAQLNLRLIRSPINGVVIDEAMHGGDLAEPGDNSSFILKLAQIDPLRVKVIVPLAYYPRIRPGQPVEVLPEQPIGGHYAAKVSVVDKVIDAASGTFQVQIELPNPKNTLPAGLRCRVRMW
jgi:RND family efflux transporter MFP subunit